MTTISPATEDSRLRMPWKRLVTLGRAYELLRADLLEHLKILQARIGFDYTRFHAIFHDEVQVYTEDAQGRPVYQWKHVDRILDDTLALRLRHVIELNSMPALLASGTQSIFNFKMNVTPPKCYAKWEALVRAFAEHCLERYGLAEVQHWYFECWNEPDLGGFWTGTKEQYFELYAASARAVKAAHPSLRVGGPATSRGQWIGDFIRWCREKNVPMDFVSTHQYPQDEYCLYENRVGSPHAPDMFFIDSIRSVRAEVNHEAGQDFPILYTEWNTQNAAPGRAVSWSRNPELDTIYSGSATLHYCTALDREVDMLGWWTASDTFEFQDDVRMPTTPFSSGGYGLVTVRGTPKPACHALHFLAQMTGRLQTVALAADRPEHANLLACVLPGRVRVLAWNHQSRVVTPSTWNDTLRLALPADLAAAASLQVIRLHVRTGQGSAYELWRAMGDPQNLTRTEEEALRLLSEPACEVTPVPVSQGAVELPLTLAPHEFVFIEISAPGAPCKEKPEGEALLPSSQLNDLLSYMPRNPEQAVA